MAAQRYLEKFTSLDGSATYTFPQYSYEWDSGQSFRPAMAYAVGADYPHDYTGNSHWARGEANETVRFAIVGSSDAAGLDTDIDTMRGTLARIGLGKLYTVGADASERWAYAKLGARPWANVRVGEWMRQPVSLSFVRLSDWLGTSLTSGTITLNVTPKTFTITNPGNETVKGAAALLLTLRANASAGFTAPQLVNAATNQQINSARNSASVNSRIRIDCEKEAVQYSNDGGITYANDYANVTLPAIQQALMSLAPGDNVFTYTDGGTANAFLDYQFYPAYA